MDRRARPPARRTSLKPSAGPTRNSPSQRSSAALGRSKPLARTPLRAKRQTAGECVGCGAPTSRLSAKRCKACAARVNGRLSTPVQQAKRQPEVVRICAQCGAEFSCRQYDARRGRKFCSRTCMGAFRAARAPRCACMVCGRPIPSWRKTCSTICRGKLQSTRQRGRRNPARKQTPEGRYLVIQFRDVLSQCRSCGASRNLDHHHVVHRQHVERLGGDPWHPDNALRLCRRCHSRHHTRLTPLPVSVLRPANLRFANDLLGDYAKDYLRRYYKAGADHPNQQEELDVRE